MTVSPTSSTAGPSRLIHSLPVLQEQCEPEACKLDFNDPMHPCASENAPAADRALEQLVASHS